MIAIYEDAGGEYRPDDYVPTALYDDGEWIAGGEEWEPYYPAGTDEAVIAGQLDGPDPVVVEVTEGSDAILESIEKDKVGPVHAQTLVDHEVEEVDEEELDEIDPDVEP